MWPYAPYLVDAIWNLCNVHLTSMMAMTHPLGVGSKSKCRIQHTTYSLTFLVHFRICIDDTIVILCIVHGLSIDWNVSIELKGVENWRSYCNKNAIYRLKFSILLFMFNVQRLNNLLRSAACTLFTSFQIKSNMNFVIWNLSFFVRDWFFTIIIWYLLFRQSNPVFIDRRQRISIAIQDWGYPVNRCCKNTLP